MSSRYGNYWTEVLKKNIIGRWSRARHNLKARENYNILQH